MLFGGDTQGPEAEQRRPHDIYRRKGSPKICPRYEPGSITTSEDLKFPEVSTKANYGPVKTIYDLTEMRFVS